MLWVGDAFSAGDVLLEIETDKAHMDVEAQDDGIVAKIMVGLPTISTYPPAFMQLLKKLLSPQVEAGTKVVQVGSRIGVLAEQGDNLNSLELPSEDNPSPGPQPVDTQSAKKDTTSPPPEDRPTQVESSAKSTPDTSHKHAIPKTPHTSSPSVSHLLNTHGITKDDISRISTTGPKGRLLKGDVLAFLGKIEKSWPKELESRIHKGEKLDLSNIKIATPRKKTETPKKVEKKAELPKNAEVKLEVSFSEVLKVQSKVQGSPTTHTPEFPWRVTDVSIAALGVHLPLSSFITKATAKANQNLPPLLLPLSASDLFDEILGLPPTSLKTTRGFFTLQVTALPSASFVNSVPPPELDIIDILADTAPITPVKKALPPIGGITAAGLNTISLIVSTVEEERARVFLKRVKRYLEKDPGSLIL